MNNKKTISIVAVLILIVLFGLGLYYFLVYVKNKANNYKLEDKKIVVGTTLSNDINDYIKINKNCKLDISNVNVNKIGKYKYYVRCGKESLKATIEVVEK